MTFLARVGAWWSGVEKPQHLRFGELGERAAKRHLRRKGLKFLTANFRSPRGEIDLIFREQDGGKKSNNLLPVWPRWRLPLWAIIAQTPPDGYAAISTSANPLI